MLFLRRFITSSSPRLALKTRHLASSRSFSSREINHKPRSPPTAQDGEDVTVRGAMLNGALATSKAVVGVAAHSPALISDAAHSFSDIATDFVTLLSYRKARQPADFEVRKKVLYRHFVVSSSFTPWLPPPRAASMGTRKVRVCGHGRCRMRPDRHWPWCGEPRWRYAL